MSSGRFWCPVSNLPRRLPTAALHHDTLPYLLAHLTNGGGAADAFWTKTQSPAIWRRLETVRTERSRKRCRRSNVYQPKRFWNWTAKNVRKRWWPLAPWTSGSSDYARAQNCHPMAFPLVVGTRGDVPKQTVDSAATEKVGLRNWAVEIAKSGSDPINSDRHEDHPFFGLKLVEFGSKLWNNIISMFPCLPAWIHDQATFFTNSFLSRSPWWRLATEATLPLTAARAIFAWTLTMKW